MFQTWKDNNSYQGSAEMVKLNIVEIFHQRGTDYKMLLVYCSIYLFLIWVYETNQTVFFKIRPDIWMLKRVETFQHFSKKITQLKIFLVPRQFFLFFYLAPKELIFLNKTSYLSCWKCLKYYIKMLTLKLSVALLYCNWSIRNYFYVKATISTNENIKTFGQIDWSVQT